MDRNKLLTELSKHKNFIFLIMCLCVHVFNAVLFHIIAIPFFTVLNCISATFYTIILIGWRKESNFQVIMIYFEILIFSLISDLCTAGQFCYIYFVLGMISVIYYLLAERTKHRHLLQSIGVLFAIIICVCKNLNVCLLPNVTDLVNANKNLISLVNLIITLFTLTYVSTLYLVELNITREKLTYNSNHDTLTGLYNRRFFESTISQRYKEYSNIYSIAMIDIDDFKKVNDTYGHDAGDKVLEMLSDCLNTNIPKNALAIRWGGEEFIVYMPNTTTEEAVKILETICNDIRSRTVEANNAKIKVTATVGIHSDSDASKYENVINIADERLYKGKHSGKNCIISC